MIAFSSPRWLRILQLLKGSAYIYTAVSIFLALRKYARYRHTCARLTRQATVDPSTHQLFQKQYVMGRKGLWLFTRSWVPSKGPIRGVIFIIHGMNEHIMRYEDVAERLKDAGFAVFGMDNQGMGRSEGDRMHVEEFTDYSNDYLTFMKSILEEKTIKSPGKAFKKLPRFILAHSLGTIIGIRLREACIAEKLPLDGLILSGAALLVDPAVDNTVMRFLGRVIPFFFPKMPGPKLNSDLISEDRTVVEHYIRDPLVSVENPSMNFGHQAITSIKYCQGYAKQLSEPLLILHGSEDKLCFPESSKQIYADATSLDKTLKLYDGVAHEIFNSTKRVDIVTDIINWLNDHLPSENSPSRNKK